MLIPLKAKIKEPWIIMKSNMLLELSQDKDLKHQDIRVLLYYLGCTDFENIINVSQADIAKSLDMKSSAISRACKKLVAKGILLETGKRGRSNVYTLNAAYGWRGRINANYYSAMSASDDQAYLRSDEGKQRRDELADHKIRRLKKDKAATPTNTEVDPNEPLPIIEYLKQQQG